MPLSGMEFMLINPVYITRGIVVMTLDHKNMSLTLGYAGNFTYSSMQIHFIIQLTDAMNIGKLLVRSLNIIS